MSTIDFKNYVSQASRYLKMWKSCPDKENRNGCPRIRRGCSSPTDQLFWHIRSLSNPLTSGRASGTFSASAVSFLLASPEEDKVSPGNRALMPAPLLVTALRTRADAWPRSPPRLLLSGDGGCSVTQSYPTLWDPIDCSPPGSSAHGISQTRILEWVVISFSRASSWPRDQVSCGSCIGRWILYHWASWEALLPKLKSIKTWPM